MIDGGSATAVVRGLPVLLLALAALADTEPATFESASRAHSLRLEPTELGPCAFELRRGEEVVARGALPRAPLDAFVLDAGPAAVLLGPGVALLGADGKLRWERAPKDLLGDREVPAEWCRAWWVDEKAKAVLLAVGEEEARTVALADGKVSECTGEELVERAADAAPRPRRAVDALAKLGRARELARVLDHGETTPEVAEHVVERLSAQEPERVLAAVTGGLGGADARLAGRLLRAAIRSRVPDLERRLQPFQTEIVEVLKAGTAPVDWLGRYFEANPTTEAVPPLLAQLQKHARDPHARAALTGALRACTGLDYGEDVAAWVKALGR
jgi:hypothetical protein